MKTLLTTIALVAVTATGAMAGEKNCYIDSNSKEIVQFGHDWCGIEEDIAALNGIINQIKAGKQSKGVISTDELYDRVDDIEEAAGDLWVNANYITSDEKFFSHVFKDDQPHPFRGDKIFITANNVWAFTDLTTAIANLRDRIDNLYK